MLTDEEIERTAEERCVSWVASLIAGRNASSHNIPVYAFIEGAKWARDQQPKWIPVEKEVPDTERVVLIVGNNGKMNTAFYSFFRGGRFIPNTPGVSGIYTWTSHWMPLPEPPKQN